MTNVAIPTLHSGKGAPTRQVAAGLVLPPSPSLPVPAGSQHLTVPRPNQTTVPVVLPLAPDAGGGTVLTGITIAGITADSLAISGFIPEVAAVAWITTTALARTTVNDSNSPAGSRFGAACTLLPGSATPFLYDPNTSAWLPANGSSAQAIGSMTLGPLTAAVYPPGTPVYLSTSTGLLTAAIATSPQAAAVMAVLAAASSTTQTPTAIYAGPLTLTPAQWDAIVTGESGGLSPGAVYYVSAATAGKLVTNAPDSNFTKVGIAQSATTLIVQIGDVLNNDS
jgi:hypothetical protein